MKLPDLKKAKPSPVSLESSPSVLLESPQRSGADDLYEKGADTRPRSSGPPGVPSGPGTFAQAVLGCFRQHPKAVGAVLAALMLPGLLAPLSGPSLFSAEPSPRVAVTEVAPPRVDAQLLALLSVDVSGVEASALASYVKANRAKLEAAGLPTKAGRVSVSVISPSGAVQDDLLRAIAHVEFGVSAGAKLARIDLGGAVFSPRHEHLKKAFEQETAKIRAGQAPTNEWFANAIAVELFESAQAIHTTHIGKKGEKTELALFGRSTSPRSIAKQLLEHLEAGPEGSAARKYLAALPIQNPDGSKVDAWQGVTRRILEVMDTESGSRRINEGQRALRAQYDEARDKGILIFRPSGDLRRAGDEETHRSGRDLSDGFEAPIAVGATSLPTGSVAPVILDGTGTGWMTLAGPGLAVPSPNPEPSSGSLAATAHVVGTAALMLEVAPNLTPDQLETLLSHPGVLLDQPGTRDGLGFLATVPAVELAREAALGKVEFSTDRSQFLFEKALKGGPSVTPDHPYRQHIEHLRSELSAQGLPTRADGVMVFVVEPSWGDHGGAVARTIAHPEVGLAPGANAHLIVDSEWYNDREKALSKSDVAHDQAVLAGQVPTAEAIINTAERQILSRAADVRRVAELSPGDRTVLLNMSYGTTSATIAGDLVDLMESAPKGSSAAEKAESLGTKRADRERAMTEWVAEVLGTPEARAQIAPALNSLAAELRAARDKGVLAFTSAGNGRESWMNHPLQSAHVEAGLDDLITVSALRINDPKTVGDETPTDFSSEGHIIFGAPGEGMPVGLRGDVKGTSFASPYGLSAAALMLAANPKLTPDQLEQLIYRPSSTANIPGHLDGLGVIDVVAAVRIAAESESAGFGWLTKAQQVELRQFRLNASATADSPQTDGS